MTQQLNVAMLGTGRIADRELAPAVALAAGTRLWSVLSRDPVRAEDFAARHGAAAAGKSAVGRRRNSSVLTACRGRRADLDRRTH